MDSNTVELLLRNQMVEWITNLFDFAKALGWATLIWLAGLAVSAIAKRLGVWLLGRLGWERFCEKWGLARPIQMVRADLTATAFTGQVIYWAVLLPFIMKALEKLELPWISWLGRIFFTLLPLVVQAVLILLGVWLLASWLGWFIRLVVKGAVAFLGAVLVQALVFSLGLYASLITLGVDSALAQPLIWILFAGTVLGLVVGWVLNPEKLFRPVVRVADPGEVR